jgi:hypothetical protein
MGDSAKGLSLNKDSIATGRYSSDWQQLPKPYHRYAPVTDINLINQLQEKRKANESTQNA